MKDGRLYTLTFTGVSEEETLATLESLTFAGEETPQASKAPQTSVAPSAEPEASATPAA